MRAARARLALVLFAVLAIAAALALPRVARWTIARKITSTAARRGLEARWASLDVRFPSRVLITQVRLLDARRGSMVFRAETLGVALDPLSIMLLHPRPSRIELTHAYAQRLRGGGLDPDTLAPAEDSARRESSEKVRRTTEALVRALLVPARRLPKVELRDVVLAAGGEGGEAGASVELTWLDLEPSRDGVALAGAGRIAGERTAYFSFRGRYGNDDHLQGGAQIGFYEAATGRHLPLRMTFEGTVVQKRRAGTIEVRGPARLQVGRLPVELTASLERDGPRIALDLSCDGMTPGLVLASVPRPLLGPLPEAGVTGSWDYRLGFRLDLSRPDSVSFHADVTPHGLSIDPEKCRLNLLRLEEPLLAEIRLPHGRLVARELSETNPNYRPLEGIDSILVHAVLTNEDGGFFQHRGFNAEAIKGAIADNLRAGAYRRGAGTITMQLARNLYLGHERTLSRKAQEVVLAWILEHLTYVDKHRLLEIYLNVIEWGPGVHGAGEAARYYFDRDPGRLTVDQALFLSTVVPSPTKWRYRFDAAGALRPFERAQMHFIGRAMIKKGWLDPASLPPADSLHVDLLGPARAMLEPEAAAAPDTSP